MIILQYVFNLFLGIDQMLNTILLGHPDETLSSRLGRTVKNNYRYFWVLWFRKFVDLLFFFDTDIDPRTSRKIGHCEKSVMPLEQRNFRLFADYEIWSWSKRKRGKD